MCAVKLVIEFITKNLIFLIMEVEMRYKKNVINQDIKILR